MFIYHRLNSKSTGVATGYIQFQTVVDVVVSKSEAEIRQQFSENISYIEDDGSVHNVYVKILEFTISYVKFKTQGGTIITIPMTRVLKVKEREYKSYAPPENGKKHEV